MDKLGGVMVIRAKYDNNPVYLNSNYIVDVWDVDKPVVTAFAVGEEGMNKYEIEQAELQRWIAFENSLRRLR